MFIDRYNGLNIIEDWKLFLKTISDLKIYLVKFYLKNDIKNPVYPNDYEIKDRNNQFIIMIIYNEYIIFVNYGKTYEQQYIKDIFFCFKKK